VIGASPLRLNLQKPLHIALIAGEPSGDQLGAALMRSLRLMTSSRVQFMGVGGDAMSAVGLTSLFSMTDIAVMGFVPVIKKLPLLIQRIRQTADAIIAQKPDMLIIIDSPDFTHRVAKRVRKALPNMPIFDYVSPTVWAWRPQRARHMRSYIDHVLALFPFEPASYYQLNGPPCTYVGHPLIQKLDLLRPGATDIAARDVVSPTILILPGSRRSEIDRLLPVFAGVVARLKPVLEHAKLILPAVPHLAGDIFTRVADWPIVPRVVTSELEKNAAFRMARAALCASGTVTLELALAGVPMVATYKVNAIEAMIARRVLRVNSVLLPNLILGQNVIPEFLQEECTVEHITQALLPLIEGGVERDDQLAALARLDTIMRGDITQSPSDAAAYVVLSIFQERIPAPVIAPLET
jgi:lipid-A-disaccharide synthase